MRGAHKRLWLAILGLGLFPAPGFCQLPPGKVVYLKDNRLYIDWDKDTGIKKGRTVFVVLGQETLGEATVAWVMDDLAMAEMATGFTRLTGVAKEALSLVPEIEKTIVRGGSLTVGMASSLETDWSKKIPTPDNWALLACLYEGLVAQTEEGRFRPVLCDSFKTGDRWVIFYLKPGLSFHSGRRLTAYEIKRVLDDNLNQRGAGYSRWAGLLAPRNAWPKRFPPLSSPIEVRDTVTLIVHLKVYIPLVMAYLASPLGWIKDFSDTLTRFPAGSGPYRVDAIRTNSVRLLRNRNYYGPSPQADTLIFRWFSEREGAEAAFAKGDVQLAWFKAGELSQGLRNEAGSGERGLCRIPTRKSVAAFFLRPVSPDSSRMLASGAAYATADVGSDLFRGDWLAEQAARGRPDSFKISFQVERELDSTGLLSAYLSSTRTDLPLFEMQLAQIETMVPAREVRTAVLLAKLKDYTGSRMVDSLAAVLGRVWFSTPAEKEPVLNGIEKFLSNRFGLVYLYRPAMVVLARPEISGFACPSLPYYPQISRKSPAVGLR